MSVKKKKKKKTTKILFYTELFRILATLKGPQTPDSWTVKRVNTCRIYLNEVIQSKASTILDAIHSEPERLLETWPMGCLAAFPTQKKSEFVAIDSKGMCEKNVYRNITELDFYA